MMYQFHCGTLFPNLFATSLALLRSLAAWPLLERAYCGLPHSRAVASCQSLFVSAHTQCNLKYHRLPEAEKKLSMWRVIPVQIAARMGPHAAPFSTTAITLLPCLPSSVLSALFEPHSPLLAHFRHTKHHAAAALSPAALGHGASEADLAAAA